jgi:hypothetical protein
VSFEDERHAIEGRMEDNYSSTDVKFENVPFKQPSEDSWVALTILSGNGEQISIGTGSASRLKRFAGIIQIDIYTKENVGTKTAKDLADTIAAIFDSVQFSNGSSGTILTRVPFFQTLGVTDGWLHSVVSVAYHRSKFS